MYRNEDQRNFARNLRNQMTEAEKRLWRFLRAGQLGGYKFRRQVAIGPYVVDFVCLSQKLIIELDGPQHQEQVAAEHDARRTGWLNDCGYRVLRFPNHQLDDEIHAVVDQIRGALDDRRAERAASPLPSPPLQGEGAGRNQWIVGRSLIRADSRYSRVRLSGYSKSLRESRFPNFVADFGHRF